MNLLVIIVICLQQVIYCIEPITISIATATGVVGLISLGFCRFKECCNSRWTKHNVSSLADGLDKFLVGQHLVNKLLPKAIKNHVEDDHPKKALVLSFHGWTGSGKNFVADMIASHVFREGTESKYVHKQIAPHHYPIKSDIDSYREKLRKFVEEKTKLCERSLFIFDEFDKMPEGLSDSLKPYIDYHEKIEGVDYRKLIFVFLNNLGGDKINQFTLKHFNAGLKREDITSAQMEKLLSVAAFNLDGGMKHAKIILSGLVDFFIPFLPMEVSHVRLCTMQAVKRRAKSIDNSKIERIVLCVRDELQYFPETSFIFSKTGCKQVEKKVDACWS